MSIAGNAMRAGRQDRGIVGSPGELWRRPKYHVRASPFSCFLRCVGWATPLPPESANVARGAGAGAIALDDHLPSTLRFSSLASLDRRAMAALGACLSTTYAASSSNVFGAPNLWIPVGTLYEVQGRGDLIERHLCRLSRTLRISRWSTYWRQRWTLR